MSGDHLLKQGDDLVDSYTQGTLICPYVYNILWKLLYYMADDVEIPVSSEYGILAFFRSHLHGTAFTNDLLKDVNAYIYTVMKGHILAC